MPSGPRRSRSADVLVAIGALVAFVAYVWVLTKATPVIVTAFSFASENKPELYAAFLAVLVGLPGLLWTLPRAFRAPPPAVVPSVQSRRQLSERNRSFLRTDVLGLAFLLLAQAPLPAPWGPAGKAATIANITKSPEIVELSAQFATYSLWVFAVGVGAAVIVKVYGHAAAYRVIGIILAIGAPVVAWFLVMRTL
ncbi:hypothetical protein FHX52_1927 [Humibacillus xanthopallidus]|uniref:Uncharacterized protein n=1 Tax=Humibacillus xanthopallidus TaxID=412689 RepID=A0A543PXK5_9MICO|nr:hypothetical protein [Humibacillus xanthopallidus]TQN48780.1 hypothetical protein FHX52_1927 [Humibacillus xanthopallidus]